MMEKKPEKKPEKRLAVDLPINMHNKLKHISINRNCSMRTIVLRALILYINNEDRFN